MLKPLSSFILVEVIKEDKKTASGIYLADSSCHETTLKGEVMSAGKDVKEIRGGQTVIFPKECGVAVQDEGKEYLVLNESNVLAVIN